MLLAVKVLEKELSISRDYIFLDYALLKLGKKLNPNHWS